MIKEANGFGATIDEAKENAIKNLQASDFDDIQFDVVSMPKKKVLGIFGGGEAEVRAYIEIPDENPNKKKNVKTGPKPAAKSIVKETKPKVSAVVATETAPVKTAASEQSAKPEYGDPVDCSKIPSDSCAAKAVDYIKAVISNLGCNDYSIKVAEKENASLLIIDGDDLSALIGRRGETLDALQYLAGLAANNGGGHHKISLNICNYREKREETLTALAKRMAAQALKAGKCRTLEPMNPYERRIIHTAVQSIDGVKSASFGEGAERRVVIAPTGVELKPRISRRKRSSGSRQGRGSSSRSAAAHSSAPTPGKEPKKDSDVPLYGKIN